MDPNKLQPGPELDRLVAEKVIGWTVNGARWRGDEYALLGDDRPSIWVANWKPSTNMQYAWMVVEHLRLSENKWGFNLFPQSSTETGEEMGPWGAYFHLPGKYLDDHLYGHGTAPQAICIAALKAVGAVPAWTP